jgi:hypothetical protein
MNERTILEWKQWFEDHERRKLGEGAIPLSSIRPRGEKIRPLSGVGDGAHPPHSSQYERKISSDSD